MPGRDWSAYLDAFHAERPGVAEAALSRAFNGSHTPYRWLARAVSATATTVLDLACGAGAMSRELMTRGRTVIGLDLSAAELEVAASRSAGPWVRADALRLPFAHESVDAVTSSMGMVVIHPTSTLLAEAARVLRPGGVLAFIAPSIRPLSPADLAIGLRLAHALRSTPRFPGPLEFTDFAALLRSHGLRKVEDRRELYHITVRSRADAELMVDALYLPTTSKKRLEAGIRFLEDQVMARGEVQLAVPMRRVVALK